MSLKRRRQVKKNWDSVEDLGKADTLLEPTGQRIVPLACTRRLVSEMPTTRWHRHATIQYTAEHRRNGTRSITYKLSSSSAASMPVPLLVLLLKHSPSLMPMSVVVAPIRRLTTFRFALDLLRRKNARNAYIRNPNTCAPR